jgi:hypothetical protein
MFLCSALNVLVQVRTFRSEFIVESGMELDTRLLTINAKLLKTPGIQFNPQEKSQVGYLIFF